MVSTSRIVARRYPYLKSVPSDFGSVWQWAKQLIDKLNAQDVVLSGGSGSAVGSLNIEAGEAVGGNRAVYVADDNKVYYANPTTLGRITIGVTKGAVLTGEVAEVQIEGEMEEPSWAWTASGGPIWLAANGILTQTLPTTGVLIQVGVPIGPTRMRIEPQAVAKIT